jgi:hypothetical protein
MGQNALEVSPKNTANTSVLPAGSRLLALMEGGQPYELHPRSLETIGQSTLGGTLRRGAPFHLELPWALALAELVLGATRSLKGLEPQAVKLGGDAMGAHYRYDELGTLVTMNYKVVVRHPLRRAHSLLLHLPLYVPQNSYCPRTSRIVEK